MGVGGWQCGFATLTMGTPCRCAFIRVEEVVKK